VGKLPRSATDAERAALLDSLEALIQDGVATIPDDGSIELVEMVGKSASADLYAQLVEFCSAEITIALLGQNQTTQSSANRASATAGLEVTKDLRDADARLIASSINQLIKWVCELNFGEVPTPVFSFWDQKEQDELQATRDKSNYDAGARFTNKYWMRGYGYQEGDLQPEPAAPAVIAISDSVIASAARQSTDPNTAAFADPTPAEPDEIDALIDAELSQWQPTMTPMVDPIRKLLADAAARGQTAAELLARLPDLLAQLDADPLADSLTRAAFTARLGADAGLDQPRATAAKTAHDSGSSNV
jgi:phage gp29-like protein